MYSNELMSYEMSFVSAKPQVQTLVPPKRKKDEPLLKCFPIQNTDTYFPNFISSRCPSVDIIIS
jgi:hypothetical protein